MKKTAVFYLKLVAVITGFLLVASGAFTEFQSTCGFVNDQSDIVSVSIPASESPLWCFFLFGCVAIFSIGFFFNHLANKILVYCITGILTPFIAFITMISQAGWGNPCGRSPGYGYYLTLLGSLLVLTATIISMHRSKREDRNSGMELLDQ